MGESGQKIEKSKTSDGTGCHDLRFLNVELFFFAKKKKPQNLVALNSCVASIILFFKFYLIFKLYIIVLVLPIIKMNPPQVYMCSPSWTPLPLPSSSHPSGLSQCTSFECPVSCIELELAFYFTYGNIHISMLFSHHPTLNFWTQSPKVCSLYLCLFCCLAYTVISTIFLNSMYVG